MRVLKKDDQLRGKIGKMRDWKVREISGRVVEKNANAPIIQMFGVYRMLSKQPGRPRMAASLRHSSTISPLSVIVYCDEEDERLAEMRKVEGGRDKKDVYI